MKIYTTTKFECLWPVGTAAVIIANSAEQALELLNEKLKEQGLLQSEPLTVDDLDKVSGNRPQCVILLDGDY